MQSCMNVIDSLQKVYDKANFSKKANTWIVTETNTGASFNKLRINNDGEYFNVIENKFYKGWSQVTTQLSSFLKDKDCDGVSMTQLNKKKYLVLSELKSALDSKDILKAYEQIVFTYMKLHMAASLCEGFDSDDFEIIGIIACHPPKDKNQETILQQQYLFMEERKEPDVRCLLKLYMEHKISNKFGAIHFTKGKPIHEKLKDKSITIYLQTSPTANDSEADIDLKSLV